MAVASEVLDLCDGLLGEAGRRRHVFSWLQGPDGWLPVDAYYPASRLVVLCRAPEPESEPADRQLVTARGLRLLELPLSELPEDPVQIDAALRRLLADAGPTPAHVGVAPAVRERAAVPVVVSTEQTTQFGVLIGVLLFVLVLAESYLGVLRLGLDQGYLLLGFGLALDGCARALGAIAAGRVGKRDWGVLCAIGGSPFVAAFALFQSGGPVKVDPAPLAGLIALLALVIVIVSLIAAVLGA